MRLRYLELPAEERRGFEYLKRSVKLEFGSLTDPQPTRRHRSTALGVQRPTGPAGQRVSVR